jgi:hypothetical protein
MKSLKERPSAPGCARHALQANESRAERLAGAHRTLVTPRHHDDRGLLRRRPLAKDVGQFDAIRRRHAEVDDGAVTVGSQRSSMARKASISSGLER